MLNHEAAPCKPQPAEAWPDATSAGGWINLDALRHARSMIGRLAITPAEKLLLFELAVKTDSETGAAQHAAGILAANLGIDRTSVLRGLRNLETAGAVVVERKSPIGRSPGRHRCHVYRIAGYQPAQLARVASGAQPEKSAQIATFSPDEAEEKRADCNLLGEKSAQIATHHKGLNDQGVKGEEKTFCNGGGGEAKPAAPDLDAILAEIPPAILDAWRQKWPITVPAAGAIRNAIREYSAEETATAIEIMLDSQKEITHPAAYMKKVLRRRVSAIVDAAQAGAPPPTRAASRPAAAEATPDTWQEIASATAAHRQPLDAGADAPAAEELIEVFSAEPHDRQLDNAGADAPAAVIDSPTDTPPAAPLDDHARQVMEAWTRAMEIMHPETRHQLDGAAVTNGFGLRIVVAPGKNTGYLRGRIMEIRRKYNGAHPPHQVTPDEPIEIIDPAALASVTGAQVDTGN